MTNKFRIIRITRSITLNGIRVQNSMMTLNRIPLESPIPSMVYIEEGSLLVWETNSKEAMVLPNVEFYKDQPTITFVDPNIIHNHNYEYVDLPIFNKFVDKSGTEYEFTELKKDGRLYYFAYGKGKIKFYLNLLSTLYYSQFSNDTFTGKSIIGLDSNDPISVGSHIDNMKGNKVFTKIMGFQTKGLDINIITMDNLMSDKKTSAIDYFIYKESESGNSNKDKKIPMPFERKVEVFLDQLRDLMVYENYNYGKLEFLGQRFFSNEDQNTGIEIRIDNLLNKISEEDKPIKKDRIKALAYQALDAIEKGWLDLNDIE